ncbi:Uncharacterised protein [Raoultella planticola]|nr:Uncharacterised protein [Raoultella planticola]
MRFPSPASDYIEDTLTVTKLCRVDANSKIVKTDSGYAVATSAAGRFRTYPLRWNY